MTEEISEEWLQEVGFRWHQLERQPTKQWLLWLGDAIFESSGWRFTSYEDLGIELARNSNRHDDTTYFCWLRGDSAGRYHRFIHIRHLRYQSDVVKLIEALVGLPFEPRDCINGCLLTPAHAESRRKDYDRLDQQFQRERPKWFEVEKDDSRGRALPEHMEAQRKAKEAKGDD